jgi:tRNA U55 pseudouridine synthase TruB
MLEDFEINKIYKDGFEKVSGIFAYDKKVGEFSHDIVYKFRRELGTKVVGHAGALDPFASGLLIILAGKATKLSEKFLTMDKEYIADVALGFKTDSLDPEGNLIETASVSELTIEDISESLKRLTPEYEQYVPLLSSVKVNGDKLRELVRKSDKFEIIENENYKTAKFYKGQDLWREINIPKKLVKLYSIDIISLEEKSLEILSNDHHKKLIDQLHESKISKFYLLQIKISCSKGTYIRKLAEDIGSCLSKEIPSMLIELRRTRIGNITLN